MREKKVRTLTISYLPTGRIGEFGRIEAIQFTKIELTTISLSFLIWRCRPKH
jgi:hypothetical protein